jgi:UDP-N-acetylglucosamine--N-acetylmuramyl-(pentapeptide) pyrophosphoryl-undecaprenol N-acetylglucosamine transferase
LSNGEHANNTKIKKNKNMSKEANNYTTKSNSTPLPTGKGVRLIISGGGTGGHIFPAISIANAIKELCPDAEILFVGAEGRMATFNSLIINF